MGQARAKAWGEALHRDARRDVDIAWQAARLADKILQAEKPRDVPGKRAMRLEIVLYLTTVKVIGLPIGLSLLAYAEPVIL